ncbi:hypothetical protein NSA24_00285 [Clostridioides mangenotii]|nr:hypothetical protein [Clostridioides mangenotii]
MACLWIYGSAISSFLECPNQNGRFTSMTLFLMVFDLSKKGGGNLGR